jgi:CRP/FNR family cyclic AMP-dependent transcriptional regulator
MSKQATMKACPLFKGFSESGMAMMEKIARERKIPANTPIFVEDMVAEAMFIVVLGVVRLSIRSADGQEQVLEKLAPGESFGELSLLIRMVTAAAETDCEVLEISRRDFATLQKQKPQACLKLLIAIVNQFGKKVFACKDYLKPLILSQIGK